jgi:hypothetical protein
MDQMPAGSSDPSLRELLDADREAREQTKKYIEDI